MEITYAAGPPETKRAFVIRSKPINNFLAFLCSAAFCGGFFWVMISEIRSGGAFERMALIPMVVIGGLILLIIVAVAWGAFRSSMRPTNWSWIVRETEVYINLRDYRNAQPGEPTPVLRLAAEDLVRAVVVRETYKTKSQKSTTYHSTKYIDLQVEGLDVDELSKALDETAQHPGIVTRKGKSVTKFRATPVKLMGEDILRTPYSRALRKALEYAAPFGEPITLDLNEQWAHLKPLQRAVEWQNRGHQFRAEQMLAREEKMSLKEARALLKDYTRNENTAA